MLSPSRSRVVAALALAFALLLAWGLLRALGPAYGSDVEGTWDISVTPDHPRVGDIIEIGASPTGTNSPFTLNLLIDQDKDNPAVELSDNEGGYSALVTFRAVAPGTATITGTAFLEKEVCPTPGSDFCYPQGFYLTTPDIVIEVSPLENCGDANGDGAVNSIDAAIVLQYVAGKIVFLAILPPMNLDVNADGMIDAVDASIILQYAAGMAPAPTCS